MDKQKPETKSDVYEHVCSEFIVQSHATFPAYDPNKARKYRQDSLIPQQMK